MNPIEGSDKRNEKYNNIYLGKVISIDDPNELGRVRVEAMPMFKDIDASHLPWALVAYQPFLHVPKVNEWVMIKFIDGDIYSPVVLGAAQPFNTIAGYTNDWEKRETYLNNINTQQNSNLVTDEPSIERAPSYPHNTSYVAPNGTTIEYDDTLGKQRIHIYNPAGTYIILDSDGKVQIHSKGNTGIYSKGDLVIRSEGTMDLKSDGNMKLQAPRIDLN